MTPKAANVCLRAMEPEDLDLLYNIENDRGIWNVGSTNVPYSRYALHNYIADTKNDIYVDGQLRLMIENDNHDVVGIIDMVNFDSKHQRAEIGIIIMDRFRHHGYGQAAVKQVIDYARRVLHLCQLYVIVDQTNSSSLACFHALGFTEGVTLQRWLYNNGSYHDAILMQFFIEKA